MEDIVTPESILEAAEKKPATMAEAYRAVKKPMPTVADVAKPVQSATQQMANDTSIKPGNWH